MTVENDYSTLYNNEQKKKEINQQYDDDDDSFIKLNNQLLYDNSISNSNERNNHYKIKQQDLYKTEYCRNWAELGTCRYGTKCRYAHGEMELRMIPRHNRYKTQVCKAYHLDGTCSYGNRCTYIHDDTDLSISDLIKKEENNDNTENGHNKNESLLSPSVSSFPTPTLNTSPPPTTSLFLSANSTTSLTSSSRNESRFFIKDENNNIKSKILGPTIMNGDKLWNSKLGLTLQHDASYDYYSLLSSSSSIFSPFLPLVNDENLNHRHPSFSSTTTYNTTSTSLSSSSSSLFYSNNYSLLSSSISSPPPSPSS